MNRRYALRRDRGGKRIVPEEKPDELTEELLAFFTYVKDRQVV